MSSKLKLAVNLFAVFLVIFSLATAAEAIREDFEASGVEVIDVCACTQLKDEIVVMNNADVANIYDIELLGEASYFSSQTLPDNFYLNPEQKTRIYNYLTVPCDKEGKFELITRIMDNFGLGKEIKQEINVMKCNSLEAVQKIAYLDICKGQDAGFQVTVRNIVMYNEVYYTDLDAENNILARSVISEGDFELQPDGKRDIFVYVNSDGLLKGTYDFSLEIKTQKSGYMTLVPLKLVIRGDCMPGEIIANLSINHSVIDDKKAADTGDEKEESIFDKLFSSDPKKTDPDKISKSSKRQLMNWLLYALIAIIIIIVIFYLILFAILLARRRRYAGVQEDGQVSQEAYDYPRARVEEERRIAEEGRRIAEEERKIAEEKRIIEEEEERRRREEDEKEDTIIKEAVKSWKEIVGGKKEEKEEREWVVFSGRDYESETEEDKISYKRRSEQPKNMNKIFLGIFLIVIVLALAAATFFIASIMPKQELNQTVVDGAETAGQTMAGTEFLTNVLNLIKDYLLAYLWYIIAAIAVLAVLFFIVLKKTREGKEGIGKKRKEFKPSRLKEDSFKLSDIKIGEFLKNNWEGLLTIAVIILMIVLAVLAVMYRSLLWAKVLWVWSKIIGLFNHIYPQVFMYKWWILAGIIVLIILIALIIIKKRPRSNDFFTEKTFEKKKEQKKEAKKAEKKEKTNWKKIVAPIILIIVLLAFLGLCFMAYKPVKDLVTDKYFNKNETGQIEQQPIVEPEEQPVEQQPAEEQQVQQEDPAKKAVDEVMEKIEILDIENTMEYQVIPKNSYKEINLSERFYDPDGDSLIFSSTQSENLKIDIWKNIALIRPNEDYYGVETVTFTAEDSLGEKTDSDPITVVVHYNEGKTVYISDAIDSIKLYKYWVFAGLAAFVFLILAAFVKKYYDNRKKYRIVKY